MLAEEPTTINAPDAGTGGEGPWQVELKVDVPPGTAGSIRAFSASPDGGEVVAEDSVQVKMGEQPGVEAYITIEEPADGATLNTSSPVTVSGMAAGLFEGNVVVQALDEGRGRAGGAADDHRQPGRGHRW